MKGGLIIDCFAGGADRQQCGSDYGEETGGSKCWIPESGRSAADLADPEFCDRRERQMRFA